MEEISPKGSPTGAETPRPSTPPVRPSFRSTSNSSTSAFLFASSSASASPDIRNTSPPYPDPTSFPASPSYEGEDPNISSGSLGTGQNAFDRRAEAENTGDLSDNDGEEAESGSSSPSTALDHRKQKQVYLGHTGRENLGALSRNSTVRSTSTFLGRVGLSPSLDLSRVRGASEGLDGSAKEMASQHEASRRFSMAEDFADRRASLSGSSSRSSLHGRVEVSRELLVDDGNDDELEATADMEGDRMQRSSSSQEAGGRWGPEHEIPALPSPPLDPEHSDDSDDEMHQEEGIIDEETRPNAEAEQTEEHSSYPSTSIKPRLSSASSLGSHHSSISADLSASSRRIRPKHVAASSSPPEVSNHPDMLTNGMPRSTSNSSSLYRTIKATTSPRPPLKAFSPPSTSPKRHSRPSSYTHSRSSSHTSTTLSTSPGKRTGLAIGHGDKGKGKARASGISPRKASTSLWEDIEATQADIPSDDDEEVAPHSRSPERDSRGDELDERIRQAEERIRQSANSRAARPRSSLSLEPEDHSQSPSRMQIRQTDTYRRHAYTPSGSDTLRRSATMGSAERVRSSGVQTPMKREPGDWADGLERQDEEQGQGAQRENSGGSGSGRRKPLPAEFRQGGSNSLFTPSPKAAAMPLSRGSHMTESPTSVKSAHSRLRDSPVQPQSQLNRSGANTPSSKRYSDTVSRNSNQYDRRQWSGSISGLPSRPGLERDDSSSSTSGLPPRADRRAESVLDTVRDRGQYRSNPSTLSSRAPLTPGDSVSVVGVPPYSHAGQGRASSMMPSHAQSEIGISARKDKDPLDVIRRMEQSREAANRQWKRDRAASVLGHSSADGSNGQRPASRAGYGHARGESRVYARPATSMSSLRDVYAQEAPRTAPVGRYATRRVAAEDVPEVPSIDVDSPLARRRMGKHMSLVPTASTDMAPRTEPRPMRSSTSLGARSSTPSLANASGGIIGTSNTAHGKLLLEAAQALESRLPVDSDKAIELVQAVRGSAVAAETTNQLIRDVSSRLAHTDDGLAEDRQRLAEQLREASKKSDLAVRELTRVLLDLPRLLKDVAGHSQSSRQEPSTGSGDGGSRYTPSRLSLIRDNSYQSASTRAYKSPGLGHRLSVDSYASSTARPQSSMDAYSRYGPTAGEMTSPPRMTARRTDEDRSSPPKTMRPSTSVGGFVARLRSPRKDSLPPIDDLGSNTTHSPDYDARAVMRNGSISGRSALDVLRSTSVRDSSSRMRQRNGGTPRGDYSGDMARGTQSMDVARPYNTQQESPLLSRTRSFSPSKESMTSEHTATTTTRPNLGANEDRERRLRADYGLRKKASVLSTSTVNTVRAVSGFAPGLMGRLPPTTPATTQVSNITAGDLSPVQSRHEQQDGHRSARTSPAIPTSANRVHSHKSSIDPRYGPASGSRDVRTSLEEVEPSSPMSRYGLAHQDARAGMPDLHRMDSGKSSRSGVEGLEGDMRRLGLGRPASRADTLAEGNGLEKSRLARLTSWRLKR